MWLHFRSTSWTISHLYFWQNYSVHLLCTSLKMCLNFSSVLQLIIPASLFSTMYFNHPDIPRPAWWLLSAFAQELLMKEVVEWMNFDDANWLSLRKLKTKLSSKILCHSSSTPYVKSLSISVTMSIYQDRGTAPLQGKAWELPGDQGQDMRTDGVDVLTEGMPVSGLWILEFTLAQCIDQHLYKILSQMTQCLCSRNTVLNQFRPCENPLCSWLYEVVLWKS